MTIAPDFHRWYCARTKPRQEHIAVDNLRRQAFETYHPKISIERIRNGKIAVTREPLFPSYVLIRFALSDDAWRSINSTRGVSALLGFGEDFRPSPLPVGEVESIQDRERKGLLFISEVKRVKKGDRVRLKFGLATDQIGTVLFTSHERVTLLLSMLGQKTRVIAPLHALEVVPNHKMLRPTTMR